MKNKINIIDNFLPKEEFLKLKTILMSDMMPWFFNDYKVCDTKKEGLNNYQFIHVFYKNHQIWSNHYNCLLPLIDKIKPNSLVRVKANLSNVTKTNIRSDFHTDIAGVKCTTAIFYINSNNGFTEFEDGKKINSVENRLITFPSEMKHLGATCTDVKRRIVLNFNYF